MNVESIIGKKGRAVFTVPPGATIQDAAEILHDKGIGALVVSTDNLSVLGIISERDIVHAIGARGDAVLSERVDSLMTRDIRTCTLSSSSEEVLASMTAGRFRHMPVVEDGVLCGLVSIGDAVKSRLDEITREADALREYIVSG